MDILKANQCDLAEILQVQYMAFTREAEEFNDFNNRYYKNTKYNCDYVFCKAYTCEFKCICKEWNFTN